MDNNNSFYEKTCRYIAKECLAHLYWASEEKISQVVKIDA